MIFVPKCQQDFRKASAKKAVSVRMMTRISLINYRTPSHLFSDLVIIWYHISCHSFVSVLEYNALDK
jgi:hypothetical protein